MTHPINTCAVWKGQDLDSSLFNFKAAFISYIKSFELLDG